MIYHYPNSNVVGRAVETKIVYFPLGMRWLRLMPDLAATLSDYDTGK